MGPRQRGPLPWAPSVQPAPAPSPESQAQCLIRPQGRKPHQSGALGVGRSSVGVSPLCLCHFMLLSLVSCPPPAPAALCQSSWALRADRRGGHRCQRKPLAPTKPAQLRGPGNVQGWDRPAGHSKAGRQNLAILKPFHPSNLPWSCPRSSWRALFSHNAVQSSPAHVLGNPHPVGRPC